MIIVLLAIDGSVVMASPLILFPCCITFLIGIRRLFGRGSGSGSNSASSSSSRGSSRSSRRNILTRPGYVPASGGVGNYPARVPTRFGRFASSVGRVVTNPYASVGAVVVPPIITRSGPFTSGGFNRHSPTIERY